MGSLSRMTIRRVKSAIAWLLAAGILLLMGAGAMFLVTEVL